MMQISKTIFFITVLFLSASGYSSEKVESLDPGLLPSPQARYSLLTRAEFTKGVLIATTVSVVSFFGVLLIASSWLASAPSLGRSCNYRDEESELINQFKLKNHIEEVWGEDNTHYLRKNGRELRHHLLLDPTKGLHYAGPSGWTRNGSGWIYRNEAGKVTLLRGDEE